MTSKRFEIKKILVAYDFSEASQAALEHAVVMARKCSAEIHLLHVLESFSITSAISQAFSKSQDEFESKIEAKALEKLKEIAEKAARDSWRPVHPYLEKGKIYKTVVAVAKRIAADIVLLGAHGVGGVQEFLIGSNTNKIVMNAECPVMAIHANTLHKDFKNLLLPIDNSTVSRQKVRYATEIARLYRSTVHVVGVASMTEPDMLKKFELKVHKVGEYLDEHQIIHTMKLVHGDQLSQIALDHSRQVNANLIVIMTEQEGSSLFLGNASQHIINHSDIPVMTIRPDKENPDRISVGY